MDRHGANSSTQIDRILVTGYAEPYSMIRFTLTGLFMGVTLIAILCALAVSDGCGPHFGIISDITFSPDGSSLAVARHDARDANVSLKRYLRDVSRTVSLLDVPSLRVKRVVNQRLIAGNCGPAFHLFYYASPSVVLLDEDRLFLASFNRRRQGALQLVNVPDPAATNLRGAMGDAIWTNPSRTRLATAVCSNVELWDVQSGEMIAQVENQEMAFYGVPHLALSPDGSMLAASGTNGVTLWTNLTSKPSPLRLTPTDHDTVALGFNPEGTALFVASRNAVRLFSLEGVLLQERTLSTDVRQAKMSPDGAAIALALQDQLSVLDSTTLVDLRRCEAGEWVRCLDFSPNGRLLAGSMGGQVVLWNVADGERLATVTPPGRWRPPWPFAAAFLAGWLVVFRWLAKHGLLLSNSNHPGLVGN